MRYDCKCEILSYNLNNYFWITYSMTNFFVVDLILKQLLNEQILSIYSISILVLQDGLKVTYFWIKEQIEKEKAQGTDVSIYGSSKVVQTQAPVQLGSLRAADGKE